MLQAGVQRITKMAALFWAIPGMYMFGTWEGAVCGPNEETQLCLLNLPHVSPSYGPFGDYFPVCPPPLVLIAHRFDLVHLILHPGHFQDHQLLCLLPYGFGPHLGRDPSLALPDCNHMTISWWFDLLVECLFSPLFVPCSNWVLGFLYKRASWVFQLKHVSHLLLPVAQVERFQCKLECVFSKQGCIGEAQRKT